MKLSIVTCTWNAGHTISHCLESVNNQSDVDVEQILVDGESEDNTIDLAKSYGRRLKKIISEPDRGIYDAMNKGILLSDGEVIGILNADDFYPDPYVLREVISVFSNTSVDACYGDLRYVDSADVQKVIRYWKAGYYSPGKFYWGWMPPHPTFFVRRHVYERLGLFNVDLGTAADYEIMLRFLLKHRIQLAYIPRVLVHMRVGGASNANLFNRFRANRMDRMAWRVNGLRPYPWTLALKPLRKLGQWVIKG